MEWIPLRWLGLGLALRCRRTRESIISSWVNLAMSSSLRCWYLSRFTATWLGVGFGLGSGLGLGLRLRLGLGLGLGLLQRHLQRGAVHSK